MGDQDKIAELLCVLSWKVLEAKFVSKRCFKSDIAFNGTVFAFGDNFIVSANGQEHIVQLQGFFSVNTDGNLNSLLGHGFLYQLHLTETGVVDTHY